jgi:MFS family permease
MRRTTRLLIIDSFFQEQKKKRTMGWLDSIRELRRTSPRDLYFLYAVTFVDSLAYFAFSYALIPFLLNTVGMDDLGAQWMYACFGFAISVVSFPMGVLADYIGVRWSLIVSMLVVIVASVGVGVMGQNVYVTALLLLGPMSISTALDGPAIMIGMDNYTNKRTNKIGFTFYYGVMNLGAAMGGPLVDSLRIYIKKPILTLGPYAFLIALTGVVQIFNLIIALFFIRNVSVSEVGIVEEAPPRRHSCADVMGLWKHRNYWRLVVLSLALVGVKSSFRYMDSIYWPYVSRAFANANTFPYMSLLSINPIFVLIITLTAVVTILTDRMHPITSMTVGSFIGGMSPFFMAIAPNVACIVLYVLFMSVGEVIWSPLVYSYSCLLAPPGQKGAFFSMAGIPLFGAKILTGGLGGTLLSRYCPPINGTVVTVNPDCNGTAIWVIIGATTISSCILLLATRRFIMVDVRPRREKRGYKLDDRMQRLLTDDEEEEENSEPDTMALLAVNRLTAVAFNHDF